MRLEQLTFSRFLAAVAIVIYHYGLQVFPFNEAPLLPLFKSANLGVSYFFILSGFVMIIAYGRRGEIDAYEFLKQRFARIYPAYFLSLFLCLLYNLQNGTRGYSSVLLTVFTVQAWYPGKGLNFNPPAWSISVEFFFYAIFPFLLNSVYRTRKYVAFLIPVALVFLLTQVLTQVLNAKSAFHQGHGEFDFLFYFPLMHVSQFLVGNLTGILFIRRFKRRSDFDLPIVFVVVCTILLMSANTGLVLSNGLMAIVFVPLILLVAANTGWITKVFERRPLVFLGDISFTIYILQFPLHQWSEVFLKHLQLSPASAFYVYMFILLLFSALCHIYIEIPARRMIKDFKLARATQVG